MQIITFNSGRQYTLEGQVITAKFDHGLVRFNDHSRMLTGQFPCQRPTLTDHELARLVMIVYDQSAYDRDEHAYSAPLKRCEHVLQERL